MSSERMQLFNQVERVYAQALIELAEAAGQVQSVAAEVAEVSRVVREVPDVPRVLASRTLSLQDRDESCQKVFAGKVSDLTLRFLRLLVKKNRFDEFPGIAAAFAFLHDERHGEIEVQAYTAGPMDASSQERITQRVGELTGRHVRLTRHDAPELLGGVKLRVRDTLVDGSVATQLRLLKEQLIADGRENARAKLASLIH